MQSLELQVEVDDSGGDISGIQAAKDEPPARQNGAAGVPTGAVTAGGAGGAAGCGVVSTSGNFTV